MFFLPREQLIDVSVVVVVVSDAVKALDVALHRAPEEPRVHGLVVSDRHVRQVGDRVELVVEKLESDRVRILRSQV